MSGGAGGSILSMIISLKNNKMLLSKRKSFKEINEQYRSKLNHHQTSYRHADPLVLEKIRNELIRERKKESIKRYLILVGSLLIAFTIVVILLDNTFNLPEYRSAKHTVNNMYKEKIGNYNLFINYGDYRYKNKEYEYAIIEYKQALKIFPDGFRANSSLANVYFTICLEKDSLCPLALETYNKLLMKFDTSAILLSKRAELLMKLGEFEKASSDLDRIMKLQ